MAFNAMPSRTYMRQATQQQTKHIKNMSTTTTHVAFFGATGGVTNAILVHTLLAGIHATALVRTPSKLRQQLTSQGLDPALLASNLTILEGNALDVASVKRTLLAHGGPSRLPQHIVTGLGGSPALTFDWRHPGHIATLDNPNICETAARTLVTALREIYAEHDPALTEAQRKPLLTFISTTGISRGPEDVPFAMRFLYHQALAVPHKDKRAMEDVYRGEVDKEHQQSVFRNVVGIRPTLLAGTVSYADAAGLEGVKVGTESKPALGYSIKRADVGRWVFENVISDKGEGKWEGEMVSLTS
ncbi:hypothetical protein LTR99_005258 [Exophiala xenobiotica]|uniref:NAD(P)-binding domain-containing protein n=1 Tax=Vermiconidia calcicola TaxID=1690605 RepID=A0AAV9Q562_9PEZI|nr:hypothetical protein LTR96_004094 [Exophiala xenobiotica]KAK5535984.1 hypothetical protein LTR25_005886 [Vermiconidia calcicola]KAK5303496.1 hypothetical protein LTR99_005258 [Exophiala xenobiotica]KAK5339706.1 hypothetical protein LTR98_004508 [Exophiala xenobiotica]KAK5360208.1 hypothetical protein LTS13_010298 [Exophiala xenobiotica]